MEKVTQGEDIIVLIDAKRTLHASSHSLKVDVELKEIRTKDTKGKKQIPGDATFSVDADGLVVVGSDITDAWTAEEMLDLTLAKESVDIILSSPKDGLTKTYKGKGFITSFSLTSPAGDNTTYALSIVGDGELTSAPTTV